MGKVDFEDWLASGMFDEILVDLEANITEVERRSAEFSAWCRPLILKIRAHLFVPWSGEFSMFEAPGWDSLIQSPNFPALMPVAPDEVPDLIERRSLNPASFRQALSSSRDPRGCDLGASSIQRVVQPVTTELSGGRS